MAVETLVKSNMDESLNIGDDDVREFERSDVHESQGEEDEIESLQNIRLQASSELSDGERMMLYEKAIRGKVALDTPCTVFSAVYKDSRGELPSLSCLSVFIMGFWGDEGSSCSLTIIDGPAIQFAQAEKLYYETALITAGTSDLLNQEKEASPSGDLTSTVKQQDEGKDESASASHPETEKADEFENLAHMCLKQKNTQLALEYCAKAVKLRQAHLGERHPATLRTLDLFTVIYAEMGKAQYSAALDKLSAIQKKDSENHQTTNEEEPSNGETETKVNENKSTEQQQAEKGERTADQDEQSNPLPEQQTDDAASDAIHVTLTTSVALSLYFIITIMMGVGLTAVICYYTQADPHTAYSYVITRLRFYYYYYFRRAPHGDHYF
ncbi:predicted protein [Nematostella vectensis]|uniref:Kinesin light chain n=1 Tax=Nematostella vectensis TaxID=45351 RepID=A7S802_NEMVE|nr:predicted protein [Nematostella vectensis]|eukprot:XP_001632274.1 predicted protein [Nematostella vectensis]